MTIIYAAATVPINPPGAASVLTLQQVWAGLELKRKQPQLFIPVISTCNVLEDDGVSVLREVVFKDAHNSGMAPSVGHTVQERITHISPLTPTAGSGVETFSLVGSASRVLNIVSSGASESELYLTFTFEWEHKDIEAGSHAAVEKQKQYQKGAALAVSGTLAAIRMMVQEGKL